jgi:CubicO group peptidase (beta-lactamase class C family)
MRFAKAIVLSLFSLLPIANLAAQPLPDSTIKKIDNLVGSKVKNSGPGFAIGIILHDSLVYTRAFGMANLECDLPISTTTNFDIASMAKQFTAFCIFLLEKQNKLNIDDDIRRYLVWFPDLKYKIAIRNLLYQTSGIRDYLILQQICGTRLDDVVTPGYIANLLSKQSTLNYAPGSAYSYSNSNYFLLDEIIETISGQSLRKFADSAIFKPLGMTNTYFEDNYSAVRKNRTYSYDRMDSTHFSNINMSSGGLYTNVLDLSKWIINFSKHLVWDEQTITKLTTKIRISDGRELQFVPGNISYTFYGWRQYYFSGVAGGYRSYQIYYPDLKTGFIILSNASDFFSRGNVAYDIIQFLVPKDTTNWNLMPKTWVDSTNTTLKNPSDYKEFTGEYVSDQAGLTQRFDLVNNKMYVYSDGTEKPLGEFSKDTFMFLQNTEYRYVFNRHSKMPTISMLTTNQEDFIFRKYVNDTSSSAAKLQVYQGRYFCPELDCFYSIELKKGGLYLVNSKYDDVPIGVIGIDHLSTRNWWMSHMIMIRDNKNQIAGFEVNTGRVMHLYFKKVS